MAPPRPARDRIRFTIEGPAELVATDNGDATSFESFQVPERAAFNGLVLGSVRASGAGLRGAAVLLHSRPAAGRHFPNVK